MLNNITASPGSCNQKFGRLAPTRLIFMTVACRVPETYDPLLQTYDKQSQKGSQVHLATLLLTSQSLNNCGENGRKTGQSSFNTRLA